VQNSTFFVRASHSRLNDYQLCRLQQHEPISMLKFMSTTGILSIYCSIKAAYKTEPNPQSKSLLSCASYRRFLIRLALAVCGPESHPKYPSCFNSVSTSSQRICIPTGDELIPKMIGAGHHTKLRKTNSFGHFAMGLYDEENSCW
jgi:hypothetical protein